MKILVAGDWHSKLHEEPVSRAFETLGHEVVCFPWSHYFRFKNKNSFTPFSTFIRKVENKLIAGPTVAKLNADLLKVALSQKPDAIFIYRGTHITASTLQKLKRKLPHCVLVGYNNDDPFAKGHSRLLWRHFLASVPSYDLMLAYRHHNLEDFERIGAQRVKLLRSWFILDKNRKVELSGEDLQNYGCDVVFIGHYEADGRLQLLEKIARFGFDLKLFGPEWKDVVSNSRDLSHLAPITPVRGTEYNKAICGAKIALCFFSKLNRDTYTRRCFEIPAAGTFMLAEYSDDLAGMYRAGQEADFFHNDEELIAKLNTYLSDDKIRQSIAASGHRRVHEDGHDVVSRMKSVISWIAEERIKLTEKETLL